MKKQIPKNHFAQAKQYDVGVIDVSYPGKQIKNTYKTLCVISDAKQLLICGNPRFIPESSKRNFVMNM
jgi:hypothetical protein